MNGRDGMTPKQPSDMSMKDTCFPLQLEGIGRNSFLNPLWKGGQILSGLLLTLERLANLALELTCWVCGTRSTRRPMSELSADRRNSGCRHWRHARPSRNNCHLSGSWVNLNFLYQRIALFGEQVMLIDGSNVEIGIN